jgi:hypothetical protein
MKTYFMPKKSVLFLLSIVFFRDNLKMKYVYVECRWTNFDHP